MIRKVVKSRAPARDELDVQAEADRVVLKHHAPVGVVINSAMEVVQFRGQTTPYLAPAPGKPSGWGCRIAPPPPTLLWSSR